MSSPRDPLHRSRLLDKRSLLNGHLPADRKHGEAMCVGCGCTDSSKCSETCFWSFVDRTDGANVGICTNCIDDPKHAPIKVAIDRRNASLGSKFVRGREAKRVQSLLAAAGGEIETHRGTAWSPDDD